MPQLALLWLTATRLSAAESTPAPQPDALFRNPDLPVAQRVDDQTGRLTVEEKISQLMMASPAIPQLGIPEYDWWSEALHGVARSGKATVFPQAIGFAATWNPGLIQRMADALSTDAREEQRSHSQSPDASKVTSAPKSTRPSNANSKANLHSL